MRKKRNTVIFAALVILVALGSLLVQETLLKKEGSYAVVSSGGEEAARLPLSKNTELVIGDKKQGYNRIRVEDGFVFVEEADCADKICVHEGKISRTGEVIACLPHQLIITVESANRDDADTVAW